MAIDFETHAARMMDHFPETVTYRPSDGAARSIKAHVIRNPRRPLGGVDQTHMQSFQIVVLNRQTAISDDTYGGISAAELNRGGDQVDIAERPSGTASSRTIVNIVEMDDHQLTLEVR